jgi:hypothetical protein
MQDRSVGLLARVRNCKSATTDWSGTALASTMIAQVGPRRPTGWPSQQGRYASSVVARSNSPHSRSRFLATNDPGGTRRKSDNFGLLATD